MKFIYFRTCCITPNDRDNYFGISFIPLVPFIVGDTYKIVTNNLEICGTYYEGPVPNSILIYTDIIDVLYYGTNCSLCLSEIPCEPPQPTPTPKQPIPVNECNVVTIFPMEIECVVSNPTLPISADGGMSVSITGGTPPYTIIWSNGNVAPAIQNLTVGRYGVTVIDYYGDFTASTTCELTSDFDCTFSATVQNYITELDPLPNYVNYTVTITGGTSPGPYTIYYNTINENNIALKYFVNTPATGVTLNELILGYNISVPNNTTLIYVYNELCDISQSYPVQNPIEFYDFCITIDDDFAIHFNPNGLFDGNQSWISDDNQYLVIFDTTLNKWRVSGGTLSYQIVSNVSYPPLSGWYTIGGGGGNLISYEGSCLSVNPLEFTFRAGTPSCECDGSIIFDPSGGVPPYQYSIDNGLTQSSSAVFDNLCEGTYTLILRDSLDNVSVNTVVLTNNQQPVTYTVSLIPTVSIISNTPTLSTKQITTTVSVSPQLSPGTSLNLTLNHNNLFKSSPSPTSSTLTTNTVLNINGVPQSPPSTTTGTVATNNTTINCIGNLVYETTTTDIWSSVIVNSGDVVVLNTTTSVSKTMEKCIVGQSFDTYSITTASIIGCSCCNVEVINVNTGSSGNPNEGGITT